MTAEALRLTEWTSCGGCAAKWGAAPLAALVRGSSREHGGQPVKWLGDGHMAVFATAQAAIPPPPLLRPSPK